MALTLAVTNIHINGIHGYGTNNSIKIVLPSGVIPSIFNANSVISTVNANTGSLLGSNVTSKVYQPIRMLSSEGYSTNTALVVERSYIHSNTEAMVINPTTDKTYANTIIQTSVQQLRQIYPVQVLNTSLSTVTGAGGAESWIS